MNSCGKDNEPGISQTDTGRWGSLPRLAFNPIWFDIMAQFYALVSAGFASLLAIFTSQLLAIDGYLDSNAMDSKGFRRRKLRKPPDKTNNRTTTAHARPQKQLNNLILRFKTNERTVSRIRQKRM